MSLQDSSCHDKVHLFEIEGRKVYRGDTLYHRDLLNAGGIVVAEFKPNGEAVTVRSTPGGAVPTVLIKDLSWTVHPETLELLEFQKQARDIGEFRTTERDFKMWKMGRDQIEP